VPGAAAAGQSSAPSAAPPFPPVDRPAAPRPDRSWSAGTILLVLGAFGLVVAALIFVTRSWEDLGLAGRTLILLGVTTVIGGLGVWVTRRPLRASAEAVWSVFLALLTLDLFAAHHEDLAGLGALSVAAAWIVWGAVGLAIGVAIALWARPHVKTVLIAPAVAGGAAIAVAGAGSAAVGDGWDVEWRMILALVVTGVLALATRPAKLAPLTTAARIVVAAFFAASYVAAFVGLVEHPALDDLAGGGHGGPMLLMAVASVVIAWVVPVVRIPSIALAVAAAAALVITPVAEAGGEEGTWVVVAALAALLAAAGSRGTSDWSRGLRLGAAPVVAGIALVHVRLFADVLETIGRIVDDPWLADWDLRLDVPAVGNHTAWVVPVVLVGIVVAAWFVARWPELSAVTPHAPAVVAAALALGTVNAVVALRWPIWAVALSLLVLAAALLGLRLRAVVSTPSIMAVLLVLVASALAAASHEVSAATWLLGGLVLVAAALLSTGDVLRHVHAVVGVGLILAGTAAIVDLLEVDGAAVPLVVGIVALSLLAAAELAPRSHPVAPAIEIASAVGLLVALVTPGSSGEIAVRWTIAGVALIALSFLVAARRWLVWPGIAALVVAYVALIVDSGFTFVEAYTLPLGAAGLAVGLLLTTRKPTVSTWALLGPGLALALLPSVPQALAEPTGLRALLLGVGALTVLAIGVRWGWQAPFLTGVTILALLVLFNIGPYANAAPRVVLIAVVSALLLGVGITWEDRVRDGRKLIGYLRSMR
jgi:hypothetical protein